GSSRLFRRHGGRGGARLLARLHPPRRDGGGALRRGLPHVSAPGEGGRPALRPPGRAARRAPAPGSAPGLHDAPRAGAGPAWGALDAGGTGGVKPHVAVIGAGAFGGWTALHLLRRGARVTLL